MSPHSAICHSSVHPLARLATVAAILLAGAAPGAAVEVEVGRVYTGGTQLEISSLGASFTVPVGWQAALPAGSDGLLMQPEADPSVYLLAMSEQATRQEMAAMMAGVIPLDSGLVLQPAAAVGERGKALTGRYQVLGAPAPMAGYGEVLTTSHGIAVAYLLLAAPTSLATWEPALRGLTDSTTLKAPAGAAAGSGGGQQSAGTEASGDQETWAAYLKGKYLVRYYTGSGYTEEQHLWLCSDGTFSRSGSGGGFGGGASGAFQSGNGGRWSATGAGANGQLLLQYGDGSTARHQLWWDYQNNELHLDGVRWFHDTNEYCR